MYVFGIVNSRRFGKSLGIDLSPSFKQCNFDCLYCELDKSKPTDKMKNEPKPEDILKEVEIFLNKYGYPDVITITANGEPTLYSKLNELIDLLNSIKGKSKLLILTNGSTIYRKDIQNSLKKLDIVKVSLDAVSEKLFKKIDRPIKSISIKDIIEGLKEFRKVFKGELIIEILVVKNVNDTVDNIKEIRDVLKEIKPDRVDLGTVDRPPAYRVFPVDDNKLLQLGEYLKDFNLNILFRRNSVEEDIKQTKEEILEILKRRPLTLEELEKMVDKDTYREFLNLVSKGELTITEINQNKFLYKI